MQSIFKEKVTSVTHWSDSTFTFTTTRDAGLKFRTGEFIMLGIHLGGKPLLRAYSIASPAHAPELQFLSIKVQDGALTSELQHVKEGDEILLSSKPVGSLVLDNLHSGRTLYLLATGTGLAPFLGTIQDIETYEKFDNVVLVHTVRTDAELAHYDDILELMGITDASDENAEILQQVIDGRLAYVPTVTREHSDRALTNLRCSTLFKENMICNFTSIPSFDPVRDCVMICGNESMNRDLIDHLKQAGVPAGTASEPGHFVYEKAFVE